MYFRDILFFNMLIFSTFAVFYSSCKDFDNSIIIKNIFIIVLSNIFIFYNEILQI